MPDPLLDYRSLRQAVDALVAPLFAAYSAHLRCRRGCYFCCVAIEVLPIELEALRRGLTEDGVPEAGELGGPPEDTGNTPADLVATVSVDRSDSGVHPPAPEPLRRCAFLGREGQCTVYAHRPLICRTHGLPLSYRLYEYDLEGRLVEGDEPRLTDLWCDLNFRDLSDAAARALFDSRGRVNMARLNEQLEALNEEFLQTRAGRGWHTRLEEAPPGYGRLPLSVLLDHHASDQFTD